MILGKSPREVARSMSLPEIELTINRHRREEADRIHTQGQIAFLASGAKLSSEFYSEFNDVLEALADKFAPRIAPERDPSRPTKRNLTAFFGAIGLKPTS